MTQFAISSPRTGKPLSSEEKRENLNQLIDLSEMRVTLLAHQQFIAQQTADYERERQETKAQLAAQSEQLKALGARVVILEDSLGQMTQQRDFYKKGFDTCSAKRSGKCKFLKVITLGMAPCR
jgi:chromosome segregation ATPase